VFEIVLFNDDTPVLRCPLHGQGVSIGRSGANDIALPQPDAPAFWCSFEPADDGYTLLDRAGEGIEINGDTYVHKDLEVGDRVQLGGLIAVFSEVVSSKKAGTPVGQRTGVLVRDKDGGLKHKRPALQMPSDLGGERLEIPDGGLRIGADDDNDIVIDDGFVSGFHVQLYHRGARLFVRDLDSTNGTKVDGVQVVESEVPLGAVLTLGQAQLKVVSVDAPAEPQVKGDGPWKLGDLVTCNEAFAKVFALIEKVAQHDVTVCVFGETGVGKELAAHAIHTCSSRVSGKFVPLNCAAIPESLLESVLFGHEKGAFTGADKQKKGAFEQAHQGTLFLDEIGELPLEMQAKLLRALESRQVQRVGGSELIDVDIRVVAATHRDLVKHVEEGKFREDLLHRLYVIPVQLPSLRARPNDIPFLAGVLAERLNARGNAVVLTDEARDKMMAHPFPGNVRELRNTVQRALIFGDGKTLHAADIEFLPTSLEDQAAAAAVYRPGMTLEDVERQAFTLALAAYPTPTEAARSLGMPKATFWRKATALGVLSPASKAKAN